MLLVGSFAMLMRASFPLLDFCQAAVSRVFILTCFILDLLTDAYLLSIPLPMLWRTDLPRPKKIGLSVVFSGAIFVMVAALLRCYFILTVRVQPIIHQCIINLSSGGRRGSEALLTCIWGMTGFEGWRVAVWGMGVSGDFCGSGHLECAGHLVLLPDPSGTSRSRCMELPVVTFPWHRQRRC